MFLPLHYNKVNKMIDELIKLEEKSICGVLVNCLNLRAMYSLLTGDITMKHFNAWSNRNIDNSIYAIKDVDYITVKTKSKINRSMTDYFITKEFAIKLIISSQSPNKGELLNYLGRETIHTHTYTRFELSFGELLLETLSELNIDVVQQYNVKQYRIDFYLPKYNVAIEYDESHHDFTIKKDKEREDDIKSEIGCKFIRLNYQISDISNVIKVLKFIKVIVN